MAQICAEAERNFNFKAYFSKTVKYTLNPVAITEAVAQSAV